MGSSGVPRLQYRMAVLAPPPCWKGGSFAKGEGKFMRYSATMLDISRIRAVSIDLDDTLWPIWPTIKRAEAALSKIELT